MTLRYVGPGGNDSNSGSSWTDRKLTLTGVESASLMPGDTVYVGPGTYREMLTTTASGGNSYKVGTVTVERYSPIVTGSGTAFSSSAYAGGQFRIHVLASGSDGVTNGSAVFTSATGDFQAGHIGYAIRISGIGAYLISSVEAASSITLRNPDNSAPSAAAASNLTYNVGPETAYEIQSVDSDTQITLTEPWYGPSLSRMSYETWRDIKYIGDATGEHTDGVGGVVRITGTNDDISASRASAISANNSYRTFRGFQLDSTTGALLVFGTSASCGIAEDMYTITQSMQNNAAQNCTYRRIFSYQSGFNGIVYAYSLSASIPNIGLLLENSIATGPGYGFQWRLSGGGTVRNCSFVFTSTVGTENASPPIGNCWHFYNDVAWGTGNLSSGSIGRVLEDFNSISGRSNVTAGASSANLPLYSPGPLLLSGMIFPWMPPSSGSYSAVTARAGFNPPPHDFFGLPRPQVNSKNSWGAIQYQPISRDTTTVRTAGGASLKIADWGRSQMRVPVGASSTTISVYVYRESNYTGSNPQMILKQPGQAASTIADTGSAAQWNQLTTTITPSACPPYLVVELASNNTASGGNYACYFDDLDVS